jgi:YtkA-like
MSPLPKNRYRLPRLFFVALLLCGCSKTVQSTTATVIAKEITPRPPQVGPITVTFRLVDDAKPAAGARITLEGDMTHAGMAPVFGDAQEIAPGEYRGQLVLNMGGDWVVLIHAVLPNGKKVEDQVDVNGVRSN